MPPTDPDEPFQAEAEDSDAFKESNSELAFRLEQLERQGNANETIIALTISALIVLSVGLNWFLLKQTRLARGAVHHQKAYLRNVERAFEVRSAAIREFVTSLESYAETDPEYKKILEQHRKGLGQYYSTKPDSN